MAKDITKQMNKIKKKITKLPQRLADGILLESLALKGEATIRRRTRSGYGITRWLGGLKNLRIKKQTIETRERLKKKGKLSNKTSPSIANLTRTGHMLDKLHITSKNRKVFEMRPDAADIEKVHDLKSRGMHFFGFTSSEFKDIKKLAVSILKAEVKKLFKTRKPS